MNPMLVQYGEISHSSINKENHSKDAIYNATKAVVRKSILTQKAKAKAANTSH
jgi:hypothetical protein